MPFVKGQSGNPAGRRREKPFRDALMVALGGKDGAKLRQLAEQVVKLALAADPPLWAIEMIVNRLDGGVPEYVEIETAPADEDDERPFAAVGAGVSAMRAARETNH